MKRRVVDRQMVVNGHAKLPKNQRIKSADQPEAVLVVLVVVVLIAVVEVLNVGVVGRVLRPFVLSTSPRRRLAPISGETAPDGPTDSSAVSAMRMAVTLWVSGTTRLISAVTITLATVIRAWMRWLSSNHLPAA